MAGKRQANWRHSDFERADIPPSRIILVEEANYERYDKEDSDLDNYSFNARIVDRSYHNGVPILFTDGRAQKMDCRFNIEQESYFTDEYRDWQNTIPSEWE